MHRTEKESKKEVLVLSSLLQPYCILIDLIMNICMLVEVLVHPIATNVIIGMIKVSV